jgi:hypothetical protein
VVELGGCVLESRVSEGSEKGVGHIWIRGIYERCRRNKLLRLIVNVARRYEKEYISLSNGNIDYILA